eukprot:SM000067S20375  [mRNA]  locus=s67:666109:667683:- [translate_table: standard]
MPPPAPAVLQRGAPFLGARPAAPPSPRRAPLPSPPPAVRANKKAQKRQQIILTQDLPAIGKVGELLAVKPGFFRNYLFPLGKARRATAAILKQIEQEQAREEAERRKVGKQDKQGRTASQLATPVVLQSCDCLFIRSSWPLPFPTALLWRNSLSFLFWLPERFPHSVLYGGLTSHQIQEDAEAIARQLQTIGGFTIRRKLGQGKQIFGSVTSQDLVDVIRAQTSRSFTVGLAVQLSLAGLVLASPGRFPHGLVAGSRREVDKKDVTVPDIREIGQFTAEIKLHPEVTAQVRINVIKG